MHICKQKHFYLFLLCFLWTQAGIVADSSDSPISVVATGIGKDGDAALRNALRAAVEQAVGVLVSAETLIEHDNVITDKILSFSGGFVESYEQVGEPKSIDGGLVSVRIAAKVKRNDLNDRLQSVGVIKIPVNPEKLRFQGINKKIKEQSQADGIDMLMDMLEEFPLSIYDIAGDIRYDENTRNVVADVEIKINTKKYEAFQKECTDLIIKLGGQRVDTKLGMVERVEKRGNGKEYVVTDFTIEKYPDGQYVVADSWPNFRRAGQKNPVNFTFYAVPQSVHGMIWPMFTSTQRKMVIKAVDSKDNVLVTSTIRAPMPSYCRNDYVDKRIVLFPWLLDSREHPDIKTRSYPQISSYNASNLWPGTPDHKMAVPLKNISPDAQITAVHISME
jgi:hypothetical protein